MQRRRWCNNGALARRDERPISCCIDRCERGAIGSGIGYDQRCKPEHRCVCAAGFDRRIERAVARV